jgi:hypothetical protein
MDTIRIKKMILGILTEYQGNNEWNDIMDDLQICLQKNKQRICAVCNNKTNMFR